MLWFFVVGSGIALGILGLWREAQEEQQAIISSALAEGVIAGLEHDAEQEAAQESRAMSPEDFWSSKLGDRFVFTVTKPREHVFAAEVVRVLAKGLVVEDRLCEALFLHYESLQWRPAEHADWLDDTMVVTPYDDVDVDDDDEE